MPRRCISLRLYGLAAILVADGGGVRNINAQSGLGSDMLHNGSHTSAPLAIWEEFDLRVVRTSTHFELVETGAFQPLQISFFESVNWDDLQPFNKSQAYSAVIPHLVFDTAMMIVNAKASLKVSSDEDTRWVLSLVTRRLDETNEFDIILGPYGECNCQIRFEYNNTLGIYFTNEGFGLYQSRISLPLSTLTFHTLTFVYDRNALTPKIQLYQNDQWVTELDNSPNFFAYFGRLGGWFNNAYQARIALHRVFLGKTNETIPDIQLLLKHKGLILSETEVS